MIAVPRSLSLCALIGLALSLGPGLPAAHAQWPGPPPPPPPGGGPPPFDRIAKDLGVTPEKLRAAFHKVHPTPPDGPPTPAQRRSDRKQLAQALGVSPERLDAVMDKYRPGGPGPRRPPPPLGLGDGPGRPPFQGPGGFPGPPPPPQDEDHGRPVALVARDLGVTPEQFRAAFRHVHPAGAGRQPTEAQRRANRKVLAETLHVSPERLDAVMDKYRPGGGATTAPRDRKAVRPALSHERDLSMEFDIRDMEPGRAYRYLASVVVPRPIALVTTTDAAGRVNAAPFSFFNLVGSQPLVVALGVGDREPGTPKDTRGNIERSGEFVVNLVNEALAPAMNICAVDFPMGVSELDRAGLTAIPASRVSVPLIAESPVQLECRLASVVEIGANKIVLGEVVFLHIRDEFVDAERRRVRTDALGLIGRMHGGGWYARTTDLFDMPRLTYAEWQQEERSG